MSSIVVDNCIMCKYQAPISADAKEFFEWLINGDGILVVSHFLVMEYIASNRNLSILLEKMTRSAEGKKILTIEKKNIESFKEDKKYKYECNNKDINHARLVFISPRKKLLSEDKALIGSVNGFSLVDGIQPMATNIFDSTFYT